MLNDPEMKEIVESFLVESNEILENLSNDLVELEKRPNDSELLNKIFRAFHTIKGTSGFLGLERLTKVTHRCEDILNKLRKEEIKLNSNLMDVILLGYDKIKELVANIEEKRNENVDIESVISVLDNAIAGFQNMRNETDVKAKPAVKEKKPAKSKTGGRKKKTEKPIETVSEITPQQNQNEVTVEPIEEAVENLNEENTAKTIQTAENAAESAEQKYLSNGNKKKEDSNIRVDVERLDELLNIVSELVLGRNQLQQVNSHIGLEMEGTQIARELADATKQIDLMTNELQLVVMKTRMVKIGKVFNRFPRLVRDLSKELNKEVNLNIIGEDTELDKTLIEEINDPLVHLIRNSIDHGIEEKEERIQKGKSPLGNLILAASQEGNHVLITVQDDGKGIDPNVIKKKAIERGLVTAAKAEELSDQEILEFIFLPGFSTATKVTNVSGRGVGMDVVRTNVAKLRGIINIESKPGIGTKMIIKLPLTLAIISGMIVRLKNEFVIIPLSNVVEVLRIHTEDIYTINKNEVIKVRDRVIPVIDINKELFDDNDTPAERVYQFIVVVGVAEKLFGLKVDETIGQQEVVIKSLGNYLKKVDGIAGSTILGDGRVVMILDINEIIQKMRKNATAKN
jgi:two-component system chemotaxis sensor kinase CheA